MKKTKVKLNKPVYLGLPILETSKTLMYEIWYDYIKPKYQDNPKLCYMDTDNFIIYIKTEDIYEDIANNVEKWFETSNYEVDRPIPRGMNKKVIGLIKDELGGEITIEFVALRPKTYTYLMDHRREHKRAKRTKKCIIKTEIKFKNYEDCLFKNKIILKSQQRFKIEEHNVYTEQINKIALSSNDDKRLQMFDIITIYPYGTNVNINK